MISVVRQRRAGSKTEKADKAKASKSVEDRLGVLEEAITGSEPVMIGNKVVTPGTLGIQGTVEELKGTVSTLVTTVSTMSTSFDALAKEVRNGNH